MTVLVEVTADADGVGYIARVRELPGVCAYGATIAEAETRMSDFAEDYLSAFCDTADADAKS